ncbi:hypothetical protein AC578_8325 [Pseudocercospora eumusae]|uniref:FAD-binding FR-type domain-containing protein n=1 Tax=Pseudocercospora eumusae TaxID=321146 RepID=A0A139GU25_9PEZI|nr:hypothetical protein AC578_8325 [Pseudocercospora eumusae]
MASRLSHALTVATATLFAFLPAPALGDKEPTQLYSWYKNYYPQPQEYCFYGCYNAVDYITFNVTPASADLDAYYLNECSNTPKIKSMFYYAQKYCTPKQAQSGRDFLSPSCQENAGFPLPPIQEYLLSEAELNQVPVLNSTAALATADAPLNTPAIPDADWQALGEKTVKEFYVAWSMAFDFSFAMAGFWGFVIAVGIVHRTITFMKKPREGPQPSWWLWIRKNLILPAAFRKHQSEAVGWSFTIPPRLESIVLALYVIMNFIMCFPGYNLFVGNQYYPTYKLQLARYVADRTGFLSIAQLPMVWLFAARNDPFMWLTGWSFATYNHFHRWIARISVVHAIIHSIAYTVFDFYSTGDASSYKSSWAEEYWYCGGIATVIMALMLGASAYYFRERYYDLFLMVHIGMSLIFFVTLWYHVKTFSGDFNYYLYPCIAIWGLDRLLRLGRTVFVSIMPRFTKGVKAVATYHRTTDMTRLDITGFMPNKAVVPGLYYYLYMPAGLRGYESHPFTLCSWRRPGYSEPPSPTQSITAKEVGANCSKRVIPVSWRTPFLAHTFLIRPYKGMTGGLQKRLLATDESVASARATVFLEGPYGEKLDLSGYSDVLVLCGGSGITAAISHAHFLMDETNYTKVHIAWAVPQRHLPDDICANELASVIHTDRVTMTVYLTSAAKGEAQDAAKLPARRPYEIRLGRPDAESVMREYRRTAKKSLAVVTCGTPQFSGVCRAAVVKVLGEEGVEIGYYNETMIW